MMLTFWVRNLLLGGSRVGGSILHFLRKPLTVQGIVFLLIAGALWTADNRAAVSRRTLTFVKSETSRLPRWLTRSQERTAMANAPEDKANEKTPESGKRWLTAWNALSIWAFGLVIWSVARARRRLVIGFEDHSGKPAAEDDKTGIDAPGFGALVAAELASLSALFSEFEEGRNIQSTPEKMKPIDATFQTENTGEFLQNTISSETKFSFGPLQIPVGLILGLVGRIVQGPRVIGQIHWDTTQRVVTIRLVGSMGNRVWTVADPAAASGEGKVRLRPASELASDVACKLFADLAMDRTVAWLALSQFVAGVRAYRRSIQTPKERKLNLREAEHRLMQAQADDPGFDLAFYNLGVVYNEQGKLEAASTAFTRAADKNQQRPGTQYALALTNFNLAQVAAGRGEGDAATLYLSKAIGFCDRALELKPPPDHTARILALKGLVFWWRGFRWPPGTAIQIREFRSAGVMFRRAVAKSWLVLYRVELGLGVSAREKPAAVEQARRLASRQLESRAEMLLAIFNIVSKSPVEDKSAARAAVRLEAIKGWSGLARLLVNIMMRGAYLLVWFGGKLTDNARIRNKTLRGAGFALRQANRLTPAELSVWLALGKTDLECKKSKKAIAAFNAAVRLSPFSADGWAFLALSYAYCDRREEFRAALRNALATASEIKSESAGALVSALSVISELYAEITRFSTSIPSEKQKRTQLGFLLWYLPRYFRLGYRLAGRELKGLTASTQELLALLGSPDALKQVADKLNAATERTKEVTDFPGKVQVLCDKEKDGVEPLKTLMAEKRNDQLDWEVGVIGHKLSLLYLKLGELAESATCLRDTMAYLEKSLPSEIRRLGLHSLLSRVLRAQGNDSLLEALEQAKKGIAWDPLSSYERIELGWVYWAMSDLATAQSAWEEVLLLSPDDPQLYVNLGLLHLRQVSDANNKAARLALIAQAIRRLKAALELFDDDDSSKSRNEARWLLAQAYVWAGESFDAVRELRTLECTDYCSLAVQITLAEALLSNENWSQAEGRFRQAAANVDSLIEKAARGVNEVPEAPLMFSETLGAISAWAHLGIASTLAEREIFLDQAMQQVELARQKLAQLESDEQKKDWEGNCCLQEGLILFKRDSIDEALNRLEKALAARVDASTYFIFANALTRKNELTSVVGAKSLLARRATSYYQEALRLDWDGRLEVKINKALAQQPPVPPAQAVSAVA
jgi:tetratricopeptide (TPR) repeat protein